MARIALIGNTPLIFLTTVRISDSSDAAARRIVVGSRYRTQVGSCNQTTFSKAMLKITNVVSFGHQCLISSIFDACRRALAPIRVCHWRAQEPAAPHQIFELRKEPDRDKHYFVPTTHGCGVPPPHGRFLYVVLASDPLRVLCGLPELPAHMAHLSDLRHPAPLWHFAIEGHTSLTRRADVFYAGDLTLEDGVLLEWTNLSGHYLPHWSHAARNLAPPVRLVLPPDRSKLYY